MCTLTEIAEGILARAKKLDAHTASVGLPSTHFFYDTLTDLPEEIEEERKALVNATQDLKRLALGPVGTLLETLFTFTDLQSLRFIYNHNIPAHVPLDGDISFSTIAKSAGVDEVLLRRFLQHAMINRIFAETRPGYVRHTAASRILRQDSEAMDTIGFLVEDLAPASLKVNEAHQKWPNSGEPNETGFNIENKTDDSFYIELAKTPERARRFGGGMRFMTRGSLYDINHLIHGYDWKSINEVGGTVVDVGGGQGGVSMALAKEFPNLNLIVQDLPGTAEEGERLLPKALKGQVSFMGHDFFQEQPIKDADVYFFRFIFHNWSDKYSIQLLKNLIPAMKDGSRVVIYEFLPDVVANTKWTEKQKRNLDMIQALGWNSLERTTPDWVNLFTSADKRLKLLGTRTPKGSSVSIIEAVFRRNS
ncbi:putative O-methyltransferase [Delitschia confertaspora ATCC 74209]|uniref:O-methyltransferase n=1 Tax=Delitschia confertaspora ATCC 74209 TaxID=1513339 RepID=A0A9P4MWT1_9PLEO|nr:putative O-methyltransferase [Delitschia confertaspora ATCC 74209]